MAKISVIVPVYRVEPYLRKCVDSIRNQTFRDLEIILVDDGSPDGCGEICDQYQELDNRVRVIHKANGGLSSARNAGLDSATGEYIGFVDSDDYIAKDMFETLYNNIVEHDADIAVCGAWVCFPDRTVSANKIQYKGLADQEAAYRMILLGDVVKAHVWDKLFKREVFENVRFPIGKIFEDIYILDELMLRAETVYIDTAPKYHYVQRTNSILHTPFHNGDQCIIEAYEKNRSTIHKRFPALMDAACSRVWHSYRFVFQKISLLDKSRQAALRPYKKELVHKLRKDLSAILRNRSLRGQERLQLLLIAIFPGFYTFIVRHRKVSPIS